MPLWTGRMMHPKMFVRMCEIIQTLGAGGLVAVPSFAELDGPAANDVTTYFQAANADAKTRIKLFRLALRRRGFVFFGPPAALRALLLG
jgi:aromatic ring hydroxylase